MLYGGRLRAEITNRPNHFNVRLQQSERTRKMKLIVEERLKRSDDNIETLVARHRSLRKQIILLSTKIEARERR